MQLINYRGELGFGGLIIAPLISRVPLLPRTASPPLSEELHSACFGGDENF